jgi:hypothetical protein
MKHSELQTLPSCAISVEYGASTYGTYLVSAETGDGLVRLGLYEGHLDDIALSLAQSQGDGLVFEHLPPPRLNHVPSGDRVTVSLITRGVPGRSHEFVNSVKRLFARRRVGISVRPDHRFDIFARQGDAMHDGTTHVRA